MNPLLVKIIMISLIVRANTSHGLSLRLDYHLAFLSPPWYIIQCCVHQQWCMRWNPPLSLNIQSAEHRDKIWAPFLFKQKLSPGSRGGGEEPDKDIGEETLTQRTAPPDQYTNTDADVVIDKPLLTTEGRKLSPSIGWNVSHSCQ